MTEAERAYLAGILDGEGCLAIYKQFQKATPIRAARWHFFPRVTVGNTRLELLFWLKQKLGGAVNVNTKQIGRRKTGYRWTCSDRRAIEVITLALPYLLLKRSQAELILSFRAKRISREDAFAQSSTLNRRGVEV